MNTPWWLTPCKPVNHEISMAAAARQQQLTKPAGSLGQLEALAVQLAGLQQPQIDAIYLTGGSSALQPLRAALALAFPDTPQVEGDLFGGVAAGLVHGQAI